MLLLSKETNVKFSTLAAVKSVDRSTLADSILTEALRGVVISLRGSLAGEAGEGGEVTSGSTKPTAHGQSWRARDTGRRSRGLRMSAQSGLPARRETIGDHGLKR